MFAMVILIPVFSGIKIIKGTQACKEDKGLQKYGFKAADKTQKKVRKKKTEKIIFCN